MKLNKYIIGIATLLLSMNVNAKVELYALCDNLGWEEHTGKNQVSSYPEIFIHNDTNHTITEDYTFAMCLVETRQCAQSFWHRQDVPQGNIYHYKKNLLMKVSLHEPGDYHYTVRIEADGEFKERVEKTCGIHVRRK